MNFENPRPREEQAPSSQRKSKQERHKDKEKYDITDLPPDADEVCVKQFLLDLAHDKRAPLLEEKMGIKLNKEAIANSSPENMEDTIKNTRLEKLLHKPGIAEAYEEIVDSFNEGKKPTITSESEHLQSLMERGIRAEDLNNYDNRQIIVGQIGRVPFKADERLVLEIDSGPEDIIPRDTGERYDEFQFNGTVIFKDEEIPPERITLVSAPPEAELPEEVNLPIKLSELKKYHH